MHLSEEYLKRHSIGVPIVKHMHIGYFLNRYAYENGFQWALQSIAWNEPTTHPGFYHVRQLRPLYNRGKTGSVNFLESMELIHPDVKLSWDKYEDYFLERAASEDFQNIVATEQQIVLAAWEMYVYINDAFFAKFCKEYMGMLYDTLNFKSSIDQRFENYNKFMKFMEPKISLRQWKSDLSTVTKNYCYWFVDLIAQNGK